MKFQRGCKSGLLTLKPILLTTDMLSFGSQSFVLMKDIHQVFASFNKSGSINDYLKNIFFFHFPHTYQTEKLLVKVS